MASPTSSLDWRDIRSAPTDGSEFLAYDPVARKMDVCVWVEGLGVDSTQMDGLYGPLDDEFQPRRATVWAAIEPPWVKP